MLTLFDCPAHNHSGHNEIRLGDTNGNPFRVMWDWQVPIEMRMEPIWTSETLPLDNPSGIILGSNAWFHVDVFPEGLVPEEKIVWESQEGKLEFVTTNTGSRVKVCATHAGGDALQVTIDGSLGNFNLPPFHVKVAPLTVITAKVGVVRAQNNELAASAQKVADIIDEANQVLLQAGLQLATSDPVEIPDIGSYYDVTVGSLEYNVLLGSFPPSNQLEIYFVGSITHPDFGPADGMYAQGGLLIATNGTGRTLGHEIAHRYWLRDVYIVRDNVSLEASGPLCEGRMPLDWGNYSAGTGLAMDIGFIMPRLLMYGVASSEKGDIASGEFYGLGWERNGTNVEWSLKNQSVGLSGMTNLPMQSN